MKLAAFETYLATHVANAEQDIKDAFQKVVDYVRGEETRIANQIEAEVQHLTGIGYTVIAPPPPVEPAPVVAEPAAPSA